jgi:hypothetical protein
LKNSLLFHGKMRSRNAGSGSQKPPEPANPPKMDLIAIPRQKKLLSLSGICKSPDKRKKRRQEDAGVQARSNWWQRGWIPESILKLCWSSTLRHHSGFGLA